MKNLILSIFCLVFTASCMSNHSEIVVDVNPLAWKHGDVKEVKMDNLDTLLVRDLDLFLRVDTSFKRGDLPFYITVQSPDSLVIKEKVIIRLSSARSMSYKSGIRDYQLKYRGDVKFSQLGEYKVTIEPSIPKIVGVWAVGIKLD